MMINILPPTVPLPFQFLQSVPMGYNSIFKNLQKADDVNHVGGMRGKLHLVLQKYTCPFQWQD